MKSWTRKKRRRLKKWKIKNIKHEVSTKLQPGITEVRTNTKFTTSNTNRFTVLIIFLPGAGYCSCIILVT